MNTNKSIEIQIFPAPVQMPPIMQSMTTSRRKEKRQLQRLLQQTSSGR